MCTINYINLTNGVEAIPELGGDYRFIRIQSTACEQHNWDRVLMDLDNDFLMNIALGNTCVVYDFGAKKPTSRALYQGIEFIKYALYRCWLSEEYVSNTSRFSNKQMNSNKYFERVYCSLMKNTKTKLKYFRNYCIGYINIKTVSRQTTHDNDKEFYKQILSVNVR